MNQPSPLVNSDCTELLSSLYTSLWSSDEKEQIVRKNRKKERALNLSHQDSKEEKKKERYGKIPTTIHYLRGEKGCPGPMGPVGPTGPPSSADPTCFFPHSLRLVSSDEILIKRDYRIVITSSKPITITLPSLKSLSPEDRENSYSLEIKVLKKNVRHRILPSPGNTINHDSLMHILEGQEVLRLGSLGKRWFTF